MELMWADRCMVCLHEVYFRAEQDEAHIYAALERAVHWTVSPYPCRTLS